MHLHLEQFAAALQEAGAVVGEGKSRFLPAEACSAKIAAVSGCASSQAYSAQMPGGGTCRKPPGWVTSFSYIRSISQVLSGVCLALSR